MLSRRVDVVVVCCKARICELIRLQTERQLGPEPLCLGRPNLRLIDHAQCDADLHIHCTYSFNHGLDILQACLPSPHISPCCSHTESSAAIGLRYPRCFKDGIDGGHLCCFQACRASASCAIRICSQSVLPVLYLDDCAQYEQSSEHPPVLIFMRVHICTAEGEWNRRWRIPCGFVLSAGDQR